MVEVVIVGAGKWALECWAALLGELAPLYRVRAVVDPRPGAAHAFAARLGLGPEAAFTDLDTALDHTPGLAAGIVLAPPDRHAHCSITLAQHGLHVLTEKPLATSRADLQALTTAVHKASVKLAVVQNYRYQARIQTARRILQAGELGELNYLVARFAADYRQPGSWDVGEAHTIPEPLLVEASIHHLDMIRYLTGQEVCAVAAMTRNPAWSSFAGPCVGGFLLRLESGALALYEANLVAAGEQHRWHGEYYRAECQHGALVCDGPTLTVLGHGRRRRTLHPSGRQHPPPRGAPGRPPGVPGIWPACVSTPLCVTTGPLCPDGVGYSCCWIRLGWLQRGVRLGAWQAVEATGTGG